MILEEYLEIIPVGKNCSYYKNLGYEVHKGVPIQVKNKDVSDGSKVMEKIQCDCCGKIESRTHRAIIDTRKAHGKDLCVECARKATQEKVKKSNLEKYGVEYPMQSKEIKEKAKQTTLEHYGVEFSFQNKDINEKARSSFKEKYGVENPLQSKKVRKKLAKTNLQKYGCENPFANEEIKEKIKNTNLLKYGVENPSQAQEIKEKKIQSMLQNGTTPTSKPQRDLFELCKMEFPEYNIELNFPLSELMLDIKLTTPEGNLIDLEYDGWYWHQDKHRDVRRDCFVKSNGYRIIRIKSQKLLPTVQQLKDAINYVCSEDHYFKEIILKDWRG